MMGIFWVANLVLIAASMAIFLIITISYLRSYRATNAKLFSGIIAFSSILLVQSTLALAIYYNLSLKFGTELAILLLAINSLSLAGYIMLYRVLNT